MALDILLASLGGVCMVLNVSCCMYVDHTGELLTNVHKIWEICSSMQQIAKDDTSWGFAEIFSWLMSWFPSIATWLKRGIVILIVIIVIFVCGLVLVQGCIACYTSMMNKIRDTAWNYCSYYNCRYAIE